MNFPVSNTGFWKMTFWRCKRLEKLIQPGKMKPRITSIKAEQKSHFRTGDLSDQSPAHTVSCQALEAVRILLSGDDRFSPRPFRAPPPLRHWTVTSVTVLCLLLNDDSVSGPFLEGSHQKTPSIHFHSSWIYFLCGSRSTLQETPVGETGPDSAD